MMTEDNVIRSFRGKHYFLSNFYETRFVFEGEEYQSAEHAYQASKAQAQITRELIKQARTPGQAKRLGKGLGSTEWHKNKVELMKRILTAKFQDANLRSMLLETGTAGLIECNNWHDNFWGFCLCEGCRYNVYGVEKNRLGRLLMELREEIRNDNA